MAKFLANKGAQHASEIPYVFDTIASVEGDALAPADQAMADAASAYWVNFAKTGDPNGAGLPDWPRYRADDDILMDFSPNGPQAVPDPWKKRLDLTEMRVTGEKHP